ncbi:MAG: STAS/SEC14 domain-containing protein, partial [Gammaproteobacteria bacterium]|nr:STAS/SEC14 domain-containing protein [Gammaproteobacteria bacterium]
EFEGWEDFPALMEHIGFIQELNEDVYRVAILGDNTWQKLLAPIAGLFVEPVIKRFEPGQEKEAKDWILAW